MAKKIDESKFYSLGEIIREQLIPDIDTIPKASRLVNSPVHGKVLNPKVIKRGARGLQYKVKGSNIVEYLKQNEKNSNNS